jgi:hypothetical protein
LLKFSGGNTAQTGRRDGTTQLSFDKLSGVGRGRRTPIWHGKRPVVKLGKTLLRAAGFSEIANLFSGFRPIHFTRDSADELRAKSIDGFEAGSEFNRLTQVFII